MNMKARSRGDECEHPLMTSKNVLYLAFETSQKTWGLNFTNGQKKRQISIAAWDLLRLDKELTRAREKLGLPEDCKVRSCYEAGRDGFSIHRKLQEEFGFENIVVDPASIEVSRRKRRKKTDRLDGNSLARMLFRYYELGETELWSVIRVPSIEAEDERQLGREMERLKKEKTQHINRIKSLLATVGVIQKKTVHGINLEELVPPNQPALLGALKREQDRLKLVLEHMKLLSNERKERLKTPQTKGDEIAAKLQQLKAIGPVCAWTFSKEYFSWRDFQNRREVGGLAGLTGTPYDSGGSTKEQGISKAGSRTIRTLSVELAWMWVRYQPDSELTKWYYARFDPSDLEKNGSTSKRTKRVGIVALSRKLLIALWKYVEFDELPEGALLKTDDQEKA